jgi:hypothetical protein
MHHHSLLGQRWRHNVRRALRNGNSKPSGKPLMTLLQKQRNPSMILKVTPCRSTHDTEPNDSSCHRYAAKSICVVACWLCVIFNTSSTVRGCCEGIESTLLD